MASSLGGAQLKVKFGESSERILADPCRYGGGCWRPLCPIRHSGANRAVRSGLLAEQEVLEVVENNPQKRISDNMPEKTVDMPVSQVELAVSSGEAGSSWPGTNDTTCLDDAIVAESFGEPQSPGIAKHSALMESELAKSSG